MGKVHRLSPSAAARSFEQRQEFTPAGRNALSATAVLALQIVA
jgi:hypothetical protein